MTRPLNIIELMDDPALLGRWFQGPSWRTWKSVMRAAYALPMTLNDKARFRKVSGGRTPPTRPVRELVAVIGRDGGKDSAASAMATHAALGDYRASLRPGERATILCLACDRDQAKILLGYIKGYFSEVPMLQRLVERETQYGLELANRTEIIIGTNDYRAVRGRTIVAALLDEAAFYPDEGSSPGVETYAALLPALARVPGSMVAIISSPWAKSGLLYDKWAKHFGKPDDRVLVVHGPSRLFNETLDQSIIDEELAADPQRASAEWLAQWRDDLARFIDREMIEAAVERGVPVRPPIAGLPYVAYLDSSSGRQDSFVVSIAHAEEDRIIHDAVQEWRAPFNPQQVLGEAASFLKGYGCSEAYGDQFAVGFVVSGLAEHGVTYRERIKVEVDGKERSLDRSSIYLSCLPLLTSGRVLLRDHPRTASQFSALERRSYPTGRDVVQHPPHGADDCCNAVAGSIVLAAQSINSGISLMRRLGEGPGIDESLPSAQPMSPLAAIEERQMKERQEAQAKAAQRLAEQNSAAARRLYEQELKALLGPGCTLPVFSGRGGIGPGRPR